MFIRLFFDHRVQREKALCSHIFHLPFLKNKVLVGKRRIRIYFHIEQQGIDYLAKLTEVYKRMNEGVMKFLEEGEKNETQS